MKSALIISVVVWLNLPTAQASVDRISEQDESIVNSYQNDGPEHAVICNTLTYWDIQTCARDLIPLTRNGLPWGIADVKATQNHNQNSRQQKITVNDPLDPINHVCEVFKNFVKCVDQHGIANECLLSGDGVLFRAHTVFTFICPKKSTDLLHDLRCLTESRVVDLLVFHLANEAGSHIDKMAQGIVNALFSFLDGGMLMASYYMSPPALDMIVSCGFICLPESVLSKDVPIIISRRCGSRAADVVRDFYFYYCTRFNTFLGKTGFSINICDKKTKGSLINNQRHSSAPPDSGGPAISSRSFDTFLEDNSPGTAMDTIFGQLLKASIKNIPEKEFCYALSAFSATFEACLFLSYDKSGKGLFNVLQFAHSMMLPVATFPDSSSIRMFRSCWKILQQTCGANSSYYEYNYRVLSGSRNIQRMMDNLTCEWQDMLIRHYIEASEHGNIWPTGWNAPERPLFLSTGIQTLGRYGNSLSLLVQVLSSGINEISAKCGVLAGNRINMFYQRLKYNWYNVLKLQYLYAETHYFPAELYAYHIRPAITHTNTQSKPPQDTV